MNNSNTVADTIGRQLKYLRISVTDRCNFRCKYCMPDNDFKMMECSDILRYEDILFASEVFAYLGVNRIRITGGEPLVRKGLCDFLSRLTKIEGIKEVMLTTNGALLSKYLDQIIASGVKRLNISLDSLKESRNQYITGVNKTNEVIDGIKLASSSPMQPLKVNSVIIRDFNDDEIDDFINFAAEYKIIWRFIEFMPIGNSSQWNDKSVVTGSEILERLSKYNPVQMQKDENTGPAINYKLNNGATVGIITPVSNHFCRECDKLRITSDGKIRPCLLSDNEIDIKDILKNRDKEQLIKTIVNSFNLRDNEHNINLKDNNRHEFKRTMSKIGG